VPPVRSEHAPRTSPGRAWPLEVRDGPERVRRSGGRPGPGPS
jgi:hypothetical protein